MHQSSVSYWGIQQKQTDFLFSGCPFGFLLIKKKDHRRTHSNTNKTQVNIQVNTVVACCSKGCKENHQGTEILTKGAYLRQVGRKGVPETETQSISRGWLCGEG